LGDFEKMKDYSRRGMKVCDYCGKENEETLVYCAGCGTELSPEDSTAPAVPGSPRILDAKNATIIFVITFAAEIVACILTVLIAETFEPARNTYFPISATQELRALMPVSVLMAMIAGGAAMWITTSKFKIPVTDTSPTGAAWVLGSSEAAVKGVGVGMLISLASQIMLHFLGRHVHHRDIDELTRMAFNPGMPRIIYIIAAVFLAPPLEEMLFRGLLFGGFCRSVGFDRAAIGVTAIFVLLHVSQMIVQPLAVLSITAAAIAALWLRLRHQAIGAAIAVHFGFNFLTVLGILLRR
jgi:membrane protease YdiL (CAAX protease family)